MPKTRRMTRSALPKGAIVADAKVAFLAPCRRDTVSGLMDTADCPEVSAGDRHGAVNLILEHGYAFRYLAHSIGSSEGSLRL